MYGKYEINILYGTVRLLNLTEHAVLCYKLIEYDYFVYLNKTIDCWYFLIFNSSLNLVRKFKNELYLPWKSKFVSQVVHTINISLKHIKYTSL